MGKGKEKVKKGKGKKDEARKDEAGVKIPKPLRKVGKEALKLAREPVVTEIVAAALLSAAAALRGDKPAAGAAKAGGGAAANVAGDAARMGESMRKLAIDLARRTLDNWERPAAERGGSGKGKKGGGGGDSSGSGD
jgi:hypothetical protein